MIDLSERRLAILAEGTFDFHHGKTAISLLRYRPSDVVVVIDSDNTGRSTGEVVGLGDGTPIVSSVREALAFEPRALLIGIAPRGGSLPADWRDQILLALQSGLDVISGLHFMLGDDLEFSQAAAHFGVQLIDVRKPPSELQVAELRPRRAGAQVVTFVGSDCAVGKMTAALEMTSAARQLGLSAEFVATGQTGIMLEGRGIAIDRVIGDFMAGAVEQMVVEASERADWVFVEGQGSLLHPGYSGVTLALIHGSSPDAMILVHPPGHDSIDEYPVGIPPLPRLVEIYEQAASWIRPSPVVGIALNTRGLSESESVAAIKRAEAETGLPAGDPVRFGGEKLVAALVHALRGVSARRSG